ncbi:MAG: hypothetical protein U1F10_11370 [Burkholderiales bacterium]
MRLLLAPILLLAATLACGQGTRMVFPNGARMQSGDTMVITRDLELRMPGTSKTRADLWADTELMRFGSLPVRAQGKVYTVELWAGDRPADGDGGFGPHIAVLAVFPPGASAPSDVAEVATDRETYLAKKVVPLGPDDAFEVTNAHLNAGEDFNQVTLFHLRDGRLRRIAEAGTYGARSPNCADSVRQVLTWQAQGPDELPPIVANLEIITAPADITKEDCPNRKVAERRKLVQTTYRWDAKLARYVEERARK